MGAGASFEVFAPGELEGEMQAMDVATSSSSSWEMFKAGYDTIVHTIIRPPRHEYSEGVALGPTCFDADDGTTISRRDFTTLNAHNEALRCSVWDSEAGRTSCVLYLHGISGSRVEGLSLLGPVLQMGHAFAALDCRGSGLSDGKYISMGLTEKDDAWTMLQALHKYRFGQFESVRLWGRCMGANAALMLLQGGSIQKLSSSVQLKDVDLGVYAMCGHDIMVVTSSRASANDADVGMGDMLVAIDGRDVRGKSSGFVLSLLAEASLDTTVTLSGLRRTRGATPSPTSSIHLTPFISWMVLDTAFIDLDTVLHDMVTTAQSSDIGWQIPSFVVSAGIALLRSTIKRTAGFDLHAVAPRDGIAHASVPAVFVHGVQDSFVPVRHSEANLKAYGADNKTLLSFPGTHDSLRSRALIESVLVQAHVLSARPTSSTPLSDDELTSMRRQLFPSEGAYPLWSVGTSKWIDQKNPTWTSSLSPRLDEVSIAPYSAYAMSYHEKASSTGGRPHVVYTVSVFAPAHLFAQLPPAASNVFGVKEKESEGRLSQDTVPGDEQHEIKSLWQSFRAQTKRAPTQRRSSWFGGAWRQNATGGAPPKGETTDAWNDLAMTKYDSDDSECAQVVVLSHGEGAPPEQGATMDEPQSPRQEEDAATFEVDRRFHDIKLLLTKLSALPGGLPYDLQTIRSKLVYSTKLGTARLDERVQLLNATLQVVCSSWTLWNHPMVLQFLSLQDVSMMSKQ